MRGPWYSGNTDPWHGSVGGSIPPGSTKVYLQRNLPRGVYPAKCGTRRPNHKEFCLPTTEGQKNQKKSVDDSAFEEKKSLIVCFRK